MKTIVDFNKLTNVILDGEDSYTDGRHSFNYELLTRTLADLGITVNKDAAWAEGLRRGQIRCARNRARMTRHFPRYVFTVEGDWKTHINIIFSDRDVELPYYVRELEAQALDPSNCEGTHRWSYEAGSRAAAAKLLGYVRAAHPDARLTLTTQ